MANDLVLAGEVVFVRDGEVLTDSLRIAEAFEKRHDNVAAAIRKLAEVDPAILLHFKEIEYQDGRGRRQPAYAMTETGFLALVPGFTGEKATRIRIKIALAFKELLEQLASARALPVSLDGMSPAQLRLVSNLVQTSADALEKMGELTRLPQLAAVLGNFERFMRRK